MDCWFTLLVLLFVLEILKKKEGLFQSFFLPPSPNPKSDKKNPVNQLIEIFWPYGLSALYEQDLLNRWIRKNSLLFHAQIFLLIFIY